MSVLLQKLICLNKTFSAEVTYSLGLVLLTSPSNFTHNILETGISKFPELFFHESVGQFEGYSRSTGPPGNFMVFTRILGFLRLQQCLPLLLHGGFGSIIVINYFNDLIAHCKSVAGYVMFNTSI